ncbi:MAG: 50S ribosomal protein L13 [Gammaproteobacteria bacterium]|nr:MAG: 50S ribosomal protein L13 [Gammaproteobacteria bacterium]PIE36274.1 MAG: 50S ribosomal protein L13 [Gammaproteobacteria bacterium]
MLALESSWKTRYHGGLREIQPIEIPLVNKTTISAKPAEVQREWFVIDAAGKTLGKVATECARRLRGKHKPIYTPHVDTGDYIIVINAAAVEVTGNKAKNKMYHHHTGYIGNMKSTSFEKMQQTHPGRAIELAVKGMLPKNALGREMFRKLRVYPDAKHNHQAQQPALLEI